MMTRYALLTFIMLFFASDAISQKRVSEKEINLQQIYIEANAAKLIRDYDEAIKLYTNVLEIDKNNDAAAYEISRLYQYKEDLENAFSYIDKAIGFEPKNEWYQRYKATLYSKSGQYLDAANIYANLSKIYPERREFLSQQISYFEKGENWEKGLEAVTQAELIFGKSIPFFEKKSFFYAKLGKKSKSTEQLELAVDFQDNNIDLKHKLAENYLQNGKEKAAVKVYNEILKFDPTNAKANIAIASSLRDGGNNTTYLNSIASIISNPDIEIDLKIAELIPYLQSYIEEQDPSLGTVLEEHISTLIDVHQDNEKAYAIYGDFLSNAKREKDAINAYIRSIEIAEGNRQVWEQMLWLMSQFSEDDAFISWSEKALDIFPNNGQIYFLHGLALFQEGDSDDALSILRQAFLMSGKNQKLKTEIHQLRGQIYHNQNDIEKAASSFEKAIKSDDENPFLKENLARYLALNNLSLEQAEDLINNADKLASNHPRIEATKALIYLKQSDFPSALKWVKKSLGHGGDQNADILNLAGDIYFKNEQTETALSYWQKSIDKGGNANLIGEKIDQKKLIEN